jgi:hypothetical protein
MGDYLLEILGIIVSVGLFFIGYRQTVGAKKERIINANAEVERILVRRIVLENYNPCTSDINRLLEGKARNFRVKVGDLYSDAQVLTNIFTRIFESDFIPQPQREDILNRLTPILEKAETTPVKEEEISDLPTSKQYFVSKALIPIAMAIIASALGGITSVLPEFGKVGINKELLPVLIAVSALSFAIIIIVYSYFRVRESQEATTFSSRSKILQEYLDFEKQVVETIRKSGAKVSPAELQDRGYDFQVDVGGKKILIEVKSTSRGLPTSIIGRIIRFLAEAIERENADEGILITNRPVELPEEKIEGKKVHILTLREFRNYLVHK